MPALATPKDEMFCQGVAAGLSHAEAWRKATGKTKNADVSCDQLLGKIGIRDRIAELKEANPRKATLRREQVIAFLCEVIAASAANVEAASPLVQSVEFVDGKPVKLRIPDKIAAVKELAKMCGWSQPARLELSATDTLSEFLGSIRRRGTRRPGMAEQAEDNGERG